MTALYFHFPCRDGREALADFMAECASQSVEVEVTRAVGWGLTARVIVSAHTGTLLRTFFSDWEMADPMRIMAKIVDQRLAAQRDRKGPMSG